MVGSMVKSQDKRIYIFFKIRLKRAFVSAFIVCWPGPYVYFFLYAIKIRKILF